MAWPSPEQLQDLGGWVFSVIVCSVVIAGFIRGDLVPGWIHKRETARADQATAVLEKMTNAVEKQTSVVEHLSTEMETLLSLLGGANAARRPRRGGG